MFRRAEIDVFGHPVPYHEGIGFVVGSDSLPYPWILISNIGVDKSFADDLNFERGIVSSRVALVLRSAEIKPFNRFIRK
ncbi:hypothetical protein Glove_689g4 [Diversispora epigaea]|uniref:Uncharacterized protein n=1 Tax=Diversispora epigaea TaxID=1348612 RepID=A0A397G268_9GLOM|nr:hypothetical protein Glove_689g4 [Diversispora epigaea]